MKKRKIIVIGATFPSKYRVAEGVYLYNLLRFFKSAYSIKVIIPQKQFVLGLSNQYEEFDEFVNSVHRPKFLNLEGLANRLKFGWFSNIFTVLSRYSYFKSVKSYLSQDVNFIYSHFLFPSGYTSYLLSKEKNIPYFIALGESSMSSYSTIEGKMALKNANGLVVVSDKIKNYLIDSIGIEEDNILLAPNRADHYIFKPLDKNSCRRRLGFNEDDKIIIFVGQFIDRKGYKRVLKALELLPYNVSCIFVGKGKIDYVSSNIVFEGSVANAELPFYYNCADFFILPTLSEGSCNAIAEAICVGLPILSSDIQEIREQTFASSTILTDPLNINDIASSIMMMYDNLGEYKKSALINAQINNLESRATSIINFIENKL